MSRPATHPLRPRGVRHAETWLCQAVETLRTLDTAAPSDVDVRALREAITFAEISLDRLRRAVLGNRNDTAEILGCVEPTADRTSGVVGS